MSASDTPKQFAGRDKRSIAWFVTIIVFILVADLVFKSWSFANVTGEPIILDRDPVDGTTIVQTRDADGKLVTRDRVRSTEPASALPHHDGMTIIPSVLDLKLTINTGAVFGIGKGKQWVFVIVSVLAVGVISFVFYRSDAKARLFHITLALILGGALGNMYDRAMFNGVRDMCHLFPGVKLPFEWSWPAFLGGSDELYPWIFNIADAALVVGVIILFILSWRAEKKPPAGQSAPG